MKVFSPFIAPDFSRNQLPDARIINKNGIKVMLYMTLIVTMPSLIIYKTAKNPEIK